LRVAKIGLFYPYFLLQLCKIISIYRMSIIPASELIINNRGAIYHVNCRPEEIANTIRNCW
jgi:hypothetical protein